jgi:hypothetical protein
MPGTAAHLRIMQLEAQFAKGPQFKPIEKALASNPVNNGGISSYAAFGAIGPDMVFWADWSKFTPIVNAVFDVYHTFDVVYSKLYAIWKPIQDAIDKVVNALTGGLAKSIQDTVDALNGIINKAMEKLITQQVYYFKYLRPAFQTTAQAPVLEKDWNWLDFLHHRRTGQFTRQLIANAHQTNKDELRAYAYGWLSHVTADVVGHPYVNLAVGGPWRSHYQRHHIQENFMDAWTWGFYGKKLKLPPSVQPGDIPFDYASLFTDSNNLNQGNLHTWIDLGDDLPTPLQKLIADTLSQVYNPNDPNHYPNEAGPFLGAKEINRAYQMQKEALEIMTRSDRYLAPPKPPTVQNDESPPTFPVPGGNGGGGGGGGGGGSFSLSALLESIFNYIKQLLGWAGDMVLWLISQVTFPLTYGLRLGLYALQTLLYAIYRQFRWALVVAGYFYPEPDDLASGFAQQFINPTGIMSPYPHLEWTPYKDSAGEEQNCLFYPTNGTETPAPIPAPYNHWPLNYPWWFIEGEKYNPDVETKLMQAKTQDDTISATSKMTQGSLGSARDFFLRRAKDIADAGGGAKKLTDQGLLPDWNLDGDRGYGFKCWQTRKSTTIENDSQLPNPFPVKLDDYL